MLSFPTSTVFERRIPKQKFYQNLDVTAEVKRLFIEQIKLITWANKLSAQTMNLAPGQTVQEIEVFRIRMAGDVLDGELQQMTTNGLRVTKIIAGAFCTDLNFQRLKEVAGALNVPLSKIGWDSNLRLNEVPLP